VSFMFENLEVYQKAVDFADHAADLTESFSRGYYFLANPLNRAALSIAVNLAEENGRFTKADRKNFFGIARDDGAMMRIGRCLIDANWGQSTDVVYQFCRQS